MRAGVGYCNLENPFECGRQAARDAIARGGVKHPGLLLAFASNAADVDELFRGMRAAVGADVPIVGGSALGVITNTRLAYAGWPVGVAALELDEPLLGLACVDRLDDDEGKVGERLGTALRGADEGPCCLLFYDSVKSPPSADGPPVMNASPALIAGIESSFEHCPPIIGAGLLGGHDFSFSRTFCGGGVQRQAAVAAVPGSSLPCFFRIMHGCTPLDGIYHVLTRVEGGVIHEIDGAPAATAIDQLYGSSTWRGQRPVRRLAIAVNYGDRFAPAENRCVARLLTGVLPDGRGVGLFEPDLADGTEVLFMLRDGDVMLESARRNTEELLEDLRTAGRRPAFALYIDCAGRSAAISETLTEEAAEVQLVLNRARVPLLGFYSGVEVAPMLGRSRGLDWTGVLLVFAEP